MKKENETVPTLTSSALASQRFEELLLAYVDAKLAKDNLTKAQVKDLLADVDRKRAKIQKHLATIEEARTRHIIFLAKLCAIPQTILSQSHFTLAVFLNLSLYGLLVCGLPAFTLRVNNLGTANQLQTEGVYLKNLYNAAEMDPAQKTRWVNITQDPGYTIESTGKFLKLEKIALILSLPHVLCNIFANTHTLLRDHLGLEHMATTASTYAMTAVPFIFLGLTVLSWIQQYKNYKTLTKARAQEFNYLMENYFGNEKIDEAMAGTLPETTSALLKKLKSLPPPSSKWRRWKIRRILDKLANQPSYLEDETKNSLKELSLEATTLARRRELATSLEQKYVDVDASTQALLAELQIEDLSSKRKRQILKKLSSKLVTNPPYKKALAIWKWHQYEVFMHCWLSAFSTISSLSLISISIVSLLVHWNLLAFTAGSVGSLLFPYLPAAVVGAALLLTLGFLTYKAVRAFHAWYREADNSKAAKQALQEIECELFEPLTKEERRIKKILSLQDEIRTAKEAQDRAFLPVRSMLNLIAPLSSAIALIVTGSLFLTVGAPHVGLVAIPAFLMIVTVVILAFALKNWWDKRSVVKQKEKELKAMEAGTALTDAVMPVVERAPAPLRIQNKTFDDGSVFSPEEVAAFDSDAETDSLLGYEKKDSKKAVNDSTYSTTGADTRHGYNNALRAENGGAGSTARLGEIEIPVNYDAADLAFRKTVDAQFSSSPSNSN